MTREELLVLLAGAAVNPDTEVAHEIADAALLEYVDDTEISEVYASVEKWYA